MGKIIQDYLLQEELGAGAFGKVFKAFNIKTNETVAIKVIPKEIFRNTPKLEGCLENEIKVLGLMSQNEHIITLIKAFKSSNNFYMVYQYCNGGTLDAFLKQRGHISQETAFSFFFQLIDAFKQLNSHQVLHRDVKPQNIFLHNQKVKLGDFGFSKTLVEGDLVTTTMIGSPIYMAPEVIKGQAYTSKADIWSLGVILYEMLYGVCPFQSSSIAGLILSLHNNHLKFPKTTNLISQKTIDLVSKLLQKDQFKRISWQELFKYIQGLKDERVKFTSTKIQPPLTPRPLSNYMDFQRPSVTSLLKIQRRYRRTTSNQKQNRITKSPQSSRTDSTTHGSKGSLVQDPNLSSRFQMNRLLNNFGKQVTAKMQNIISSELHSSRISDIQKAHRKILEAANLAVDIFIDDQKEGALYYYLIINKIRSGLDELISLVLPDESILNIASILNCELKLLERQVEIFKDYLVLKGVAVDDILDIPTYLKIKQLSFSKKTDLWNQMFKYFNGNSALPDHKHLSFNHSYSVNVSNSSDRYY